MDRARAHRIERGNNSGAQEVSDYPADFNMDSEEEALPPPTRGRGRGGRGRGRGRGELFCCLLVIVKRRPYNGNN